MINLCYSFTNLYIWYIEVIYGAIIIRQILKNCIQSKRKLSELSHAPNSPHMQNHYIHDIASRILNVADINDYTIGKFIYNYMDENVSNF